MPKQRRETYLYHYTTAEGLIGIMRNRNIWATDVFYLNDWEEFLGGINLARDYLVCLRNEAATCKVSLRLSYLTGSLKKSIELAPVNLCEHTFHHSQLQMMS